MTRRSAGEFNMTSDLESLLAAIVADPGDDTARLAYADCLQEHGNVARAAFIRLQVEAERLHPNSNARGEFEKRAWALFEQHWIEWWSEVCVAAGLRPPTPKPAGRLGRLAQRVGVRTSPGAPYQISTASFWNQAAAPGSPSVWQNTFQHNERTAGFLAATFRRGFAGSLVVGDVLQTGSPESSGGDLATKWARVAPLDSLHCELSRLNPGGLYLNGLRALTVSNSSPREVGEWLYSPYLLRLETLTLFASQLEHTAADWGDAFAGPRARQLTRLSVPVPQPDTAAGMARAPNLRALRALALDLETAPAETLAAFTGSPLAERIEELTLSGRLTPAALAALGNGAWPALRKLTVSHYAHTEIDTTEPLAPFDLPFPSLTALVTNTNLPAVEELTFRSLLLNRSALGALVDSPLLKQLRHFCCRGWLAPATTDATASLLAQVVDANRIETFAIGVPHVPERTVNELREKFGDRVRFLTN